jgi:acetylornithine deacetylase/succinyl-diaminopimelate desuccinylase-like protein
MYRRLCPQRVKIPHTHGINISLDKRPLFPLSIFHFELSIADWRQLGVISNVETNLNRIIEEEARLRGINYNLMNSGAVHDSSLLADITSVGMIFVPSVNGRSHVQYEKTEYEDIKQGCDLLLGAVYKLAS